MPTRDNERLVCNLDALCERAGVTKYRLAKNLKVATSAISMIASGQRQPSPDMVVRICDQLGCQPGELFTLSPVVSV